MPEPRVILWTPLTAHLQMLATALQADGANVTAARSEAEAIELLQGADAALLPGVGTGYTAPLAQAVHASPSLRWIQLIATGREGLDQHGAPPHVTVTDVGNTAAPVVAEHAMALLLALVRRIDQSAVLGQRANWDRATVQHGIRSLEGMTLCLVGYGRIGKEIARRAQAFGMRCIAVNRRGTNDAPELAEQVLPLQRLHEALGQSDAVALSLPASADTLQLFGAAEWAACKPQALVVNVGRGTVIDTDSLVAALHSGRLAGAGLDVTEPEPLPDGHPLWTAPGALISPHVGGAGSTAGVQRLAALLTENLRRFGAGDPLLHVLQPGR